MRVVGILLVVLGGGCSSAGDTADLVVDLRTDYPAGDSFRTARIRVFEGDSTAALREASWNPPLETDLSIGVRVAEFVGLPTGSLRVHVDLIGAAGTPTGTGSVRVSLSETQGVSVVIRQSCAGITCPGPADEPDRTACYGGACVTEACAAGIENACETSTVPPIEFPRRFAQAVCAAIERCSPTAYDLQFGTEQCAIDGELSLRDALEPLWLRSFAEGALIYRGDLAEPCFDALAATSCSLRADNQLDECEQALRGVRTLGEACRTDFDCAGSESFCDTSVSCPGVCRAQLPEGSACVRSAACQHGANCRAGRCLELAAIGEVCGLGSERSCGLDAWCPGASENPPVTGTCELQSDLFIGTEGQPCSIGNGPLCVPGLSCIFGTAGQVCAAEYAPGAPCQAGLPDPCPRAQYCDVDPANLIVGGTCTPRPVDGQPCSRNPLDPIRCAFGHQCIAETCVVKKRVGEACTASEECYSGSCDGETCVTPECS